jgi:predicted DCC family thiol-disulfide oxidoreductase YuxK
MPWSVHDVTDADILCYDSNCPTCTVYVEHLFEHQGSFALPFQEVMTVVEKTWPHLMDILK